MPKLAPIALLLLIGMAVRSQPFPELRFTQLTERDGLSCNKTTGVTQDAAGIIWISTNNGLNRFDGFGFTRFFANPGDSSTIPANEIESVDADRHDHIWLQSAAGISRFNTVTHKVDRFDSGRNTPSAMRSFQNASVWFDKNDDAYITAPTGLYHFDADGRYKAIEEDLQPFTLQQFVETHYSNLINDRHGGLWAYCGNRIYRVDPETKRVRSWFSIGREVGIQGLLFDSANIGWVSTWEGGIFKIGPAGVIGEVPGDFHAVVIRKGLEWRFNGRRFLVFGTNKPGLLLVDPVTLSSRNYQIGGTIGGMGDAFIDRQNTLWVTTDKGLFYLNPSATLFDIIPVHATGQGFPDPTYLSTPYNMREEKSGYWIARRYLGGVLWFTTGWKPIRSWSKIVDSVGPEFHEGPANVKEAYDFKQVGDTMFMTTEWGMMLLDLKTMRRTMITAPNTFPITRLRTIVPENDHRWWIRSFSQGVFIFDPVKLQFVRHYRLMPGDCNGCSVPSANYLLRDRKGRVFVTSNAGLFHYDAALDSFVSVHTTDNQVIGNSLFGVVEDGYGNIWIGLDHGICSYNPDSNRVMRIMTEDNSIGPVERVAVDSTQNVWFRSINGYWCWLRHQDRLIRFRIGNGLPDNDEGLFYTASNGNVYAGCQGGIVWFHADQLARYHIHPDVRIVDVFAGDKPIPVASGPHGEKRLTLGPRLHSLQIVFDVINYDMPENNLYFYKLSSTPGDWTPVDNGRLSFNNLAPGEYTLTVKGGNKLAGLFESTDQLVFTILPYWYQSLWFKALVGLALLFLVLFAVRRRISHIRREAAFRQKITDTELQALRAQMNPHFIFNSLNSIENFIMKNEKWLASDYLNKFARLFRMILHSSRNELVPFSKDMEAIQLYVDLERLRYNNKFVYETEVDPQLTEGEFRVPSLLVQPYVENAIVHGLGLSTREDGYVRLSATLHGEYICYRITDNGVGRARAREVRRVNNPNHRSVGLAITENRINIFSHQQNSAGRVSITDLSNEDGTAAGTLVEVMIKAV
ncbi:MAG TPA: histidine kinase [Puia sp.]|nr:histidine kinase [Puia sp.]